MDKEQIIGQMNNIINQSEKKVLFEDTEIIEESVVKIPQDKEQWFGTLPKIDSGQFLLIIEDNKDIAVVCVEELDWFTAQTIELSAFRNRRLHEGTYYAGEYECRETLQRAIVWVADTQEEVCVQNTDGNILKKLPIGFIDTVWVKYYPKVNLTAREANALYASAISYFTGDIDGKPIPPLVVEIDMLIKMGTLSRAEIRAIKYSEMQRIKLILKARAEALRMYSSGASRDTGNKNQDELMNQAMQLPPELMPPGLKGAFMIPR